MSLSNGEWIHTPSGYVMVYRDGKCHYKHRLVMEEHLGRKLKGSELVHHKDDDKTNNAIGNLEIVTRGQHNRVHGKFQGNNNPSKNMTEKHKENLRCAWIKRKEKFGSMGTSNPERLRKLGSIASNKRWKKRG